MATVLSNLRADHVTFCTLITSKLFVIVVFLLKIKISFNYQRDQNSLKTYIKNKHTILN